jgi:hypothetical protein
MPAMSMTASAIARRSDARAVHAYTAPVVRELPSQPADPFRGVTW